MVQYIYEVWKTEGYVPSLAFSWPGEPVKAEDGTQIEGLISLVLPEEEDKRYDALKQLVERTKAYGLFLVERRGGSIEARFETRHGAKAWVIPIERHGDRDSLGQAQVKDGSIGFLWKRTVGSA